VSNNPGPPGKRYRLRGLIGITIAGIVSWALVIWLGWLIWKLLT
jgi:hypothetical protein